MDIAPLISDLRVAEPLALPGAALTVRAWVEDESTPASVRVYTSANNGPWESRDLSPEASGVAVGEVYAGSIGPFASGETVRYYVTATDDSGQVRSEPRAGARGPATLTIVSSGSGGAVSVNEVMASNSTTIADAAGEFDDWIEIYNGTPGDLSLSGLFITDDLAEPSKFALPDSTLAPGAFALVWADGDTDQGPMHAPFRLSASGESAAIFRIDAAGDFRLVSGFAFGEQETDVSFGRTMDGGGTLTRFGTPTPEASNNTATSGEPLPSGETLTLLSATPNPFRNALTLTLRLPVPATLTLDLYDALGRHLGGISQEASGGTTALVWRGALPAGVYIARVRAESSTGVSTTSRTVTVVR